MSRTTLITALCDIYGYSKNDFTGRCFSDIWEYWLQPQEQLAVRQYVAASEL